MVVSSFLVDAAADLDKKLTGSDNDAPVNTSPTIRNFYILLHHFLLTKYNINIQVTVPTLVID